MAHQGFDLQLTRYDERGWRATFYTTCMEHSPTSATGTGGSGRRGGPCEVLHGRPREPGAIERGRTECYLPRTDHTVRSPP
jgi:hypothetical protein